MASGFADAFVKTTQQRIEEICEWCRLASIGESTGRKIKAAGKGPRFVRLTEKKLGVTLREHRRWMKARME